MSVLNRSTERNKGLEELKYILKVRSKVLIVHYSCESFLNLRNRVPRITSVAVHNIDSGQTVSFSIYLTAQIKGLSVDKLSESRQNKLEKETLNDFYKFVRKHKDYKWVHWKMRDQVYGFEAINSRYRILGGRPASIANDKKYDLPSILEQIYTSKYEARSEEGKLLALAKRNDIPIGHAIPGYQEAKAYTDGSHQLLWMSSQQKVKIISELLLLASSDKLRVNANWFNVYGFSLKLLKKTSVWSLVILVLSYISEGLLSITINSLSEHYSIGSQILSILGLK